MSKPSLTCSGCKKHPADGDSPHWPFCSERCKMLDLGDWAAEKFRLQSKKSPEEEAEEIIGSKEFTDD